ncbi:MAG: cyclic nucleotide-binding domain-containing protein [Actinomycetota bacterium]
MNGDRLVPERRTFAKGSVIFREGDKGHEAYLLQLGTVRIFKTVAGRKVTIGRVWPSQVFGELALLDDSPRMAAAMADDDVTCLVLRKDSVRGLLDGAPDGLRTLLLSLLGTMRSMGDDLAAARAELEDYKSRA